MAARKKQLQPAPAPPRNWWRANQWFLAGLLIVVVFNCFIRIRLAPTPLERDEGEYAYAGQLLLQGVPPYKMAYNMKFPGAYLAYATMMAIYGETTQGIHVGMALVTSLTALLTGLMGRRLLGPTAGVLAAASCALLSATPEAFGLAGHATHFIALFTTAGGLLLLQAIERPAPWRWVLAGSLFGGAILMKQHAVVLAGAIWLWLAVWQWQQRRTLNLKTRWGALAGYCGGCVIPLLVTCIALAGAGVWPQFIFWTVQYATEYASAASLQTAAASFWAGFGPVFFSNWALWVLGGIGAGVILRGQTKRRDAISLALFLGAMLATVPGYHFRGHYFLAALPGLSLLIAAAWEAVWRQVHEPRARAALVTVLGAALATSLWHNQAIWFQLAPDQVARQIYSLNPFPESPKVAEYLRNHTTPTESIAVIGSEPQIYFHAQRHAATGYIYMYPLTEPQPLAQRMRDEFARELTTAQPRYVVFVDIITSWVSLTAANTSVLTWWNEFSKQYEPVGAVALAADHPTTYCWDEATVRTLDLTQYHLIVYRRKQ